MKTCPTCGRTMRLPPGHPVEELAYACTSCGNAARWAEEAFRHLTPEEVAAIAANSAMLAEFWKVLVYATTKRR